MAMVRPGTVKGLEISQDMEHQQRQWRFERIGWGVMACVLAAALLGLLGPGPLSGVTVGEGSSVQGDYDRFGRNQTPQTLRLHIVPAHSDSLLRLRLNRDFVDNVEMGSVDPAPVRIEAERNHLIYVFARDNHSATATHDSLTFTFHYQPTQYGTMNIEATADSLPPLRFSQFVYP